MNHGRKRLQPAAKKTVRVIFNVVYNKYASGYEPDIPPHPPPSAPKKELKLCSEIIPL